MPDYRLGRLKGEFVCVWEEGGKRRRYRLGTREPKEARATLQAFIRRRQAPLANTRTVEAIWHDYIAEKRAEGKVSASRMVDAWKRLNGVFGHLSPADISPACVRSYVAGRRAQRASDGTIHTELGYLRAALRHTLKQNAPAIALPSKPRPRTRHLTPEEARRLIDGSNVPHVRLYIRLALHTAGRPSSILQLVWGRVDFTGGRIYLDDPTRDRTAKGRATVPLAGAIRGDLRAAQAMALSEYVIEWNGKRVGSIKKAIQRAAQRAGLDGVTPYVLRHTAAVWMAESGVPIPEIGQFLGHSNSATTYRVYARFSPEHLRRASDAISNRLSTVDTDGAKPNAVNTRATKQARNDNTNS
jgi:integrase